MIAIYIFFSCHERGSVSKNAGEAGKLLVQYSGSPVFRILKADKKVGPIYLMLAVVLIL